MRYYIIETQVKEDDINLVTTEKFTFASALSFFYGRKEAQVAVTEGYKAFHTMLVDENLAIIEQYDVSVPTTDPRAV